MAIIKKITKRGFTLIELMIVVVIIGILAALAIYGVQKYVANSKSAEARLMLGRMSKDMLAFFEGERMGSQVLALGGKLGISRRLCPPTGNAVPTAVPKAEKYQPKPSEFEDGEGWACLQTTITSPIYYQYAMTSSQTGSYSDASKPLIAAAANQVFEVTAVGDLDGDTKTSKFSLDGKVQQEAGLSELVLTIATSIDELAPSE